METFNLLSGTKIPCMGLGCGAIPDSEMETCIRAALDVGYRLFDCALLYGNEPSIGQAFENIFKEGKYCRQDVFLTTKLPMIANHPDRVERFLQKSLDNLRTSYVDLYLIHFPVGFEYENDDNYFPKKDDVIQLNFKYFDLEALWKGMEKQVQNGRTKSIGISNFSINQISKLLSIAKIPPVNLQIEIHAYFQQKELREYCKSQGIIVSAYAPLGSPGRRDAFKPNGIPEVLNDPVVVQIAQKYGKTTPQVLLRFLTNEGIVVLPKSKSSKRIIENFNILDFELAQEDCSSLRNLDRGEIGRSFDYLKIFKGLIDHPGNPMPIHSGMTK